MTATPEAPSAMMAIQGIIQNFCSLLAGVLQLEVEVVDHRLIRIAGTGSYGDRFGFVPKSNTRLLRAVIENQQEVAVIDSRFNSLCKACEQREECKERAFLGVPIMSPQRCLGVISLIAVDQKQHQRLSENVDMFLQYIRHVSRLMVTNLASTPRRQSKSEALWLTMIERMDQGVIVRDDAGRVTFINSRARNMLQLPESNVTGLMLDIKPQIWQKISPEGHHQHIVTLPHQQLILTGQLHRAEGRSLFLLAFHQTAASVPAENNEELPGIEQLIGQSVPMKKLKRLVTRVAPSPSSVLISGESGTGKEVVARAIHRFSRRHDQPFVAINCAAIPENLLESELFGYVKGAFTGAAPGGRPGLILSANGGTLFLDEIGDMPLGLQARLLRAIESREVQPVGGNRPVPVDIRIISATHQHLEQAISTGRFREDLYYRLNVIPLFIPPLREREGDVELLLHYFHSLHTRRINCTWPGISPEVLRLLQRHSWPGNVRELSNLVEYLINIVPDGGMIDSSLLPPVFHTSCAPQPQITATQTAYPLVSELPEQNGQVSLKTMEKSTIEEVLHRCNNNKKQAADELGIGLATLYRKIKKYGLV
ncbi:sigma 54-interacting transcriptional regulator [Erwinia mallotivora]|uniref:sigma 54-interacting transcriptional regulator n=1 Tax=Erwinia mallotivora TaxID=69222 RepID=UPI0021C1D923|nr:sigma 54-interacting transcriptional regulator [Erwinia mallotivora]